MCERKRSGCGKPSVGEDVVDGYAFPGGVELRPRRHAVDVSCHPGSWERVELRPAPRFDRTRSDLQRESPVRGIDPRRGAGRKHREIIDEVLSRGDSVRKFRSGLAACETASDHGGFPPWAGEGSVFLHKASAKLLCAG